MQKTTSVYKKDDLVLLKEMVDITYLLHSLGLVNLHETNKEVRCACTIHGGDNKSAFKFNKETRTWVCFTHKCHEIHGNDIIGLIKGSLGIDFVAALNYLKDLVGDVGAYQVSCSERKLENERKAFINQYSTPTMPDYVSEDNLKIFAPFRSNYFISKGVKKDTLDYFEIAGGFTDSWGILRDIIPIRDVKNDLVAYSLRDTRKTPPSDDYKYILTEGFIKDKVLYNLNNARIFGPSIPLIVVEGFKSVWKFHEYGFFNTIAAMGSSISS